jgi:hypothetical protein
MKTVREDLGNPDVLEAGWMDAPLLLLGLVYREVSRSLETEPGDSSVPAHLINSPFGRKELDEVQSLINGIQFEDA